MSAGPPHHWSQPAAPAAVLSNADLALLLGAVAARLQVAAGAAPAGDALAHLVQDAVLALNSLEQQLLALQSPAEGGTVATD